MAETMLIREILDAYGKYTGLTTGTSMNPLLHEQKDNIIVVKKDGRLSKYDVGLYVTSEGKYIMHRVVEVHDDHYIFVGDNMLKKEYVTDDMVCGVLAGFYKNGRHYVDCTSSKPYLLYSKIWTNLLPVRPLLLLPRRTLGWIKRHIVFKLLKRGDNN